MRKPRKGETVCNCDAYDFPHRFFGGACIGEWIITETWEKNYGGGICKSCNMYNGAQCDIYEGLEDVRKGECFMEFVEFNEINIKNT